jgi:hypothetical protein
MITSSPTCRSAFGSHVCHVVLMRTQKQMRRVDAGRVVAAGTVMQNVQAIGYRPVMQLPRQSMRIDDSWSTVAIERTVTIPGCATSPQPTLAKRVNVLPEAHGRCDGTVLLGARRRTEAATASIEFCLPSHEVVVTNGAGSGDDSLRGHLTVLALGATPRTVQPVAGFSHAPIIPQISCLHAESSTP